MTLVARLEPGQTLRYDLSATLEVSTAKGAAERLEQRARVRLTVAEVDDSGAATVRGRLESVSAKWRPAEGDEQAFDWKEGQELAEEAPALARVYGELATTPFELTVAAGGVIKAVSGPEKAARAAERAKLRETVLGVLGPGAMAQTLSPVFSLDAAARPREPGATWTSATTIPGAGAASIKLATERSLRRTESGTATVEARLTQSWQPGPGKTDPTEPAGVPSDQKGNAEERWDTASARLITRAQDSAITWTLRLQAEPPLESARTIKSHVELKRVE